MDFTPDILNHRPGVCRACGWNTWVDGDQAPAHTCRTPPSTPRTELQDARRAALAVYAKRELETRERRMAQITLAQVRRGRV